MRSLFFLLVLGFGTSCFAQGFINNGARIVLNGTVNIVINGSTGNYTSQSSGLISNSTTGGKIILAGNWVNNAGNSGFSNDGASVELNGANQSIGGSASTSFFNLNLLGTGTKTLNVATTVGGQSTLTGVLDLGSRPLSLNSNRLTISNPNASAIARTTGYIISETNLANNPSIIRWQMGTTIGAHIFPFGKVSGLYIPFTFNKLAATSSTIDLSTRPTTLNDNQPWATGVTHMFVPTIASDGAAEAVIDRWWEMTATANVSASFTFSYDGAENTLINPYNTGGLGAQYWSSGAWLPNVSTLGTGTAVTSGVGTVNIPSVTASAVYRPWVLSSQSAPLPVEWLSFNGYCNGVAVNLNWSTATEINNDYFTVQRSVDGGFFEDIGIINGSGNSSQPNSYQYTDIQSASSAAYYRIRQTDYNGLTSYTAPISIMPCSGTSGTIDAFGANGQITVLVQSDITTDYQVEVYDLQGRQLQQQRFTADGNARFELNGQLLAQGTYIVSVSTSSGERFSKKIVLF